jgi:hypothetical protein
MAIRILLPLTMSCVESLPSGDAVAAPKSLGLSNPDYWTWDQSDFEQAQIEAVLENIRAGQELVEAQDLAEERALTLLEEMRALAQESAAEGVDNTRRAQLEQGMDVLSDFLDQCDDGFPVYGGEISDWQIMTPIVQTGLRYETDDRLELVLGDLSASTLGVQYLDLDIRTRKGASDALLAISAAEDQIAAYQAQTWALQATLESEKQGLQAQLDD